MSTAKPIQVAPSFYVLGTRENPIYLLGRDAEWALIDGGLSGMQSLVLAQLEALLPSLGALKHWFITHSHYDHCGLLTTLTNYLPNVTIYASREAINVFQTERERERICTFNHEIEQRWSPTDCFTEPRISLASLPIVELRDSLTYSIGSTQQLTALATPGHSACMISLVDQKNGWAFVSDTLGEWVSEAEWFPLIFDQVPAYLASINRIASLRVDTLALGHHGVLSGRHAQDAPLRSVEHLERLVDWIQQQQRQGVSLDMVSDKLTQQYSARSASFLPAGLFRKSMLRMLTLLAKANLIHFPPLTSSSL